MPAGGEARARPDRFRRIAPSSCAHTGDHFAPLSQYRQFHAGARASPRPRRPNPLSRRCGAPGATSASSPSNRSSPRCPRCASSASSGPCSTTAGRTTKATGTSIRASSRAATRTCARFVKAIRAQGLRPRLWLAPLAADPGSDVLHDHADMLLLDQWGAFQKVSWWNALTQCPAYQPTIDYYVALTKKIIGDWGFEGLKLDGQHLNAVAPCYNKAHKHSHPDRVGREVRRLLEGDPQGGARGESGSGGGALSLRHGVRVPQPAGHGPVPRRRIRSRPGRCAARARASRR